MKSLARFAAAGTLAAGLLLLASCYPFIGGLPTGAADGPSIQHVPYSGSFSYSVDTGTTPRDVYFVFTNPDKSVDVSAAPSVASGSITINGKSLPALVQQALPSVNSAPLSRAERIAEFNRNPWAYTRSGGVPRPQALISDQPASADGEGDTEEFALDPYGTDTVQATCQYASGPVVFGDGRTRALNIWVADANWDGTGLVPDKVHLDMITFMANQFLKSPASPDDIYHWDTAVVGEPWGPHNYSNLISWDANNTITILLSDLNPPAAYTSGGGVIVGYFYGKDNFSTTTFQGSNQRIMFYIDATLYAKVEASHGESGDWEETNYWPKVVISTLAHEFQHMIQFYQKQILLGASTGTDRWINEMCSMIMEDLVADKQNVEGPRGVTPPTDGSAGTPGIVDGRIPDFNLNSSLPLVRPTDFNLDDYSVSYAFGAWLARNYGGAQLLRRIVQSPDTNESAVVNAVSKATGNPDESFAGLLERWAAAVLLSSSTNAPHGYRYNKGTWFTSAIGGESFRLGSINFFNYSPSLTVFSAGDSLPPTSYHSANVYYQAAQSQSGSRTWNITVPDGVMMNVVIW